MLKFDQATMAVLENAYLGLDITRRRRASLDAVRALPGDVVIDIGCGNGLMTAELARAVGPKGRVVGVDPSAEMRAAAAERCGGLPQAELAYGAADALPVADGAADKAVSLQVFEYLDDIPAAIREAHRALRPGGRLVVGDMHFDTFAWAADDEERMARMIASWDRHVAERRVPAILPGLMTEAGFEVEEVVAVPFSDATLQADGFAAMLMILMETYAVENGHLTAEDARGWAEEQRRMAAEGRFFFSLTHFVVSARKL